MFFKPQREFLDTEQTYVPIIVKNVHGWILQKPEYGKIIVYCPSNYGNISFRQSKINKLHQLGYNVIAFDYSGFGKSNGIPSEQNLYNDASSIMAMVYGNYLPQDIVIYGEQLGTSVAAYIARKYNIDYVILESPINDIRDILSKLPKVFKFLFSEFNTSLYLNGYMGKSLILYGSSQDVSALLDLVTESIECQEKDNFLQLPWPKIKDFLTQN